jgi:hypothetical protein
MANYRFYFLDDSEHIKNADYVECENDRSALEKARELCEAFHIDVWLGARRVGRVNKGERPLAAGGQMASS